MKFSRTLASSALVLVAAFVVASSASYRHQPPRGDPYGASPRAPSSRYSPASHQALAHYGGGNCHGRNCHPAGRQTNSNFGPYHSYAVRPAVYGGRGLYAYRGYARYPPAPRGRYGAQQRHRAPRGHAGHSRRRPRGQRFASGNSYNYNSNSNYNANSNRHAQLQHNIGGQNYLLRPVKALVLTPPSYHNNNNNNNNNFNNNHHGANDYARPATAAGHHQHRVQQHRQAPPARQYAGHAAPARQAHRYGRGNGHARRPASGGY